MTSGNPLQFDMKRVTTPLLIHMVGQEMRFPRLFLLKCKLTLNRFKRGVDRKFPREFVDLVALPAWVYLNLKKKVGPQKAFEIMRVVLLTGGTAIQNLQFDTVNKQRSFETFADLELENNRTGIVRWNTLELVERTAHRFEIKVTRCLFHEFAVSIGLGELTPVVCQIDNAMFNSYLPDAMIFDRGGSGRRIADGKRECTFIWSLRDEA